LAEGTLYITGALTGSPRPVMKTVRESELGRNRVVPAERDSTDSVTLVGCGRASLDEQIIIVNPETGTPCQDGEAGEIWLAGPMVAKGYWNLPDETEDAFRAHVGDKVQDPFCEPGTSDSWMRTANCSSGRIKDLIIVAGRNHYPQDIEQTVERSSPAVRAGNCIAFSVDAQGEEQLVVVFQIERQYRDGDVAGLVKVVRQAITEAHGVRPHDIVTVRQPMPKTTSGKLQRWTCRADYLSGRLKRAGETA
jgi:acyl-CoA synthetase (AMP-forming)/AMP-acid ligase II